jgi:nitrogen fixation NifU-like protein
MSDLKDLYQDAILDHYRRPRNFQKPAFANRQAEDSNPLCGDILRVFMQIEDGVIADISFTGTGCAISIASASMMTVSLKGKTETEARAISERFLQLVTHPEGLRLGKESLGELALFSGVREYPVRVKCATLAWQAMQAALDGGRNPVATE